MGDKRASLHRFKANISTFIIIFGEGLNDQHHHDYLIHHLQDGLDHPQHHHGRDLDDNLIYDHLQDAASGGRAGFVDNRGAFAGLTMFIKFQIIKIQIIKIQIIKFQIIKFQIIKFKIIKFQIIKFLIIKIIIKPS